MEKNISRRDVVKMMGVGAATILTGSLVGCSSKEEDKIALDRLSEYHAFKPATEDVEERNNYLFIREQRYLDGYMYLYLVVEDNKYLYDNAFMTIKDNDKELHLDYGASHIPFEPLIENSELTDLGNAVEIVSSVLGEKEYYLASEINTVPELLKEKNMSKKLVRTR